MEKQQIKTLVSDLGGVYLNRGIWLFWDYLYKTYGIPVENAKLVFLKNYKQYFSGFISEETFWINLLTEIDLKADWHDLRNILLNLFEVNSEVADLYSHLRSKGVKLVLLSDQSKEWWPYLDEKLKISQSFDYVIVSSFVGLHKPNPDIYKLALNESQSKAEESVFIDDIDYNLTPAKDLGMSTILFENHVQLEESLKVLSLDFG